MKKVLSFMTGFFTGAIVVGLITLLFAPDSGAGFRDSLKNTINNTKEEISKAAQQKRSELEAELSRLRKI